MQFLKYQWYRIYQYGIEKLSVVQFKLESMPNWTTRPRWKASRGKISPTAKAMYTDMLNAFAAGDKQAINQLCLGNFAKKLTAAIDRRPSDVITKFEIMSFDKRLFYPRVIAHQVHNVNPNDKEMYTEQAVVAILSTQKATRHVAKTGELITGSTRLQRKVEHVVLSRQVSNKTYQSTPWRIWGTVPVTTMERYREEQEWINQEQAKRAGWEGPTSKKN
jgi:protein MBA1